MNPDDIKNIKLSKSGIFGYKVEDVDTYIEFVKLYIEKKEVENIELQKKIKILAHKVKEYKDEEHDIKQALINAQKLSNTVLNDAKEKANIILDEAKDRVSSKVKYAQLDAENILKETKYNIEKERKSLFKIQKEVSTFKAKLLSLYRTHLDSITALPEIDDKDEKNEIDNNNVKENNISLN